MLTFRTSVPGDLPRLRSLWRQAFGDGDDFLDLFFSRLWKPRDGLLALEGGRVEAMLFLLPMTLREAGGGRRALPYVYALATDPGCRGKGYGRQLLAWADRVARERGAAGICTVPAEPSLHAFFASAGYGEGLYTRRRVLPAEELAALEPSPLSPEDYAARRRAALDGTDYIDLPGALISFQRDISRLSGADLYALPRGGWAAAERMGEQVALKDLGADRGERTEGFGMWKWFGPPGPREAFLGLAFD